MKSAEIIGGLLTGGLFLSFGMSCLTSRDNGSNWWKVFLLGLSCFGIGVGLICAAWQLTW